MSDGDRIAALEEQVESLGRQFNDARKLFQRDRDTAVAHAARAIAEQGRLAADARYERDQARLELERLRTAILRSWDAKASEAK